MVDVLARGAAGNFSFETHPVATIAKMRRKMQIPWQRTDVFKEFLTITLLWHYLNLFFDLLKADLLKPDSSVQLTHCLAVCIVCVDGRVIEIIPGFK